MAAALVQTDPNDIYKPIKSLHAEVGDTFKVFTTCQGGTDIVKLEDSNTPKDEIAIVNETSQHPLLGFMLSGTLISVKTGIPGAITSYVVEPHYFVRVYESDIVIGKLITSSGTYLPSVRCDFPLGKMNAKSRVVINNEGQNKLEPTTFPTPPL